MSTLSLNMEEEMYFKKFKWSKTTDLKKKKKEEEEEEEEQIKLKTNFYSDKSLGVVLPDFEESFIG